MSRLADAADAAAIELRALQAAHPLWELHTLTLEEDGETGRVRAVALGFDCDSDPWEAMEVELELPR